jgi:hypothetical protein
MPSSLQGNIGISIKLELNFNNIDIIVKLLSSKARLIIYGLSQPIDRNCRFHDCENKPPFFDDKILEKLSGLKNEEEFMECASKVSEIRDDEMVLRKKIEYFNFEDENEVNDYLELLENYDRLNDDNDLEYNSDNDSENNSENNSDNDSEDETQENIVYISDQDIYKKKLRKRYEISKVINEYVDYDLNKKTISFLFYLNLLNFDISLSYSKDYDTDFGNVGKLSQFMNNIDNATKFFTDFGIDKENLSVFNYNTSEGY